MSSTGLNSEKVSIRKKIVGIQKTISPINSIKVKIRILCIDSIIKFKTKIMRTKIIKIIEKDTWKNPDIPLKISDIKRAIPTMLKNNIIINI